MTCSILSVGVVAPGLPDWATACRVLRGHVPYRREPIDVPAPSMLPANERRRSTLSTRLALEAARQATSHLGVPANELATVFASSEGDLALVDHMCTDLYKHHCGVSPTVFHNSVHNAVAGYWSIGHKCRRPSASIAGWDDTFAIGLLESFSQATCGERPVLLIAYDVPGPEFLDSYRHFEEPFACAFVISDCATNVRLMSVNLALDEAQPTLSPLSTGNRDLDDLRMCNPAARALPLIHTLANNRPGSHRLRYQHDLDLVVTLG